MSAKTNAEVVIGGKVYTLSGFESEEYLQKIASYINTKISEAEELDSFKHLTPDMRAILTELNIADDYFKAKAQVEKLELDLEAKEREIYNLKHDLISNQVQTETNTQRIEELEAENKELLLNKTKLEAALEDSLLGKVTSAKTDKKKKRKPLESYRVIVSCGSLSNFKSSHRGRRRCGICRRPCFWCKSLCR